MFLRVVCYVHAYCVCVCVWWQEDGRESTCKVSEGEDRETEAECKWVEEFRGGGRGAGDI